MKAQWFGSRRSLEEQMLGLEKALDFSKGKSVLDLGCAEGLIAEKFASVATVHALDNNQDLLDVAKTKPGVVTGSCDLNKEWPKWLFKQYDVVLALALFHKLKDPSQGVSEAVKRTRSLLVVRLPLGSDGLLKTKTNSNQSCDLNSVLPQHGFSLEVFDGPRGELVQYWSR